MVCIPCIIVPILLWIYKRYLERYLDPYISPLIKYLCSKKAVQEVPKENGKHCTESRCENDMHVALAKELDLSKSESNIIANGFSGNGPTEVSDKKAD